jgi:hypothetical protein
LLEAVIDHSILLFETAVPPLGPEADCKLSLHYSILKLTSWSPVKGFAVSTAVAWIDGVHIPVSLEAIMPAGKALIDGWSHPLAAQHTQSLREEHQRAFCVLVLWRETMTATLFNEVLLRSVAGRLLPRLPFDLDAAESIYQALINPDDDTPVELALLICGAAQRTGTACAAELGLTTSIDVFGVWHRTRRCASDDRR